MESNDDFIFHVQLGTLDDYYLFEHKSKSKRTRRSAVHHVILKNHVLWFEQQKVHSRKKRDLTLSDPLVINGTVPLAAYVPLLPLGTRQMPCMTGGRTSRSRMGFL